jgi:peptidoglycan/xylan/chitin deacetylase (PgdA/CDA1 family)
MISLTFDDDDRSHLDNAIPILSKYNFKASFFVPVGFANQSTNQTHLNFEELLQIQKDGHEIASHTMTHPPLPKLSKESLEYEISTSKSILEERGFLITSFTYPYGFLNEEVTKKIQEVYPVIRTSNFGFNDLKNPNFKALKSIAISNKDSPSEICALATFASKQNSWVILVFHRIIENPTYSGDIPPQNLDEILKCLEENKLIVKTLREIYLDSIQKSV